MTVEDIIQKINSEIKDKVLEATKGLQDGTLSTGYKVPAPAPAASGAVTTTAPITK